MFNRLRNGSVLLLAGLLSLACDSLSTTSVALGVTRELAESRAATISEVAYSVSLTIPAERAEAVQGETLLSFRWDDAERGPIVVDFKDPGERVDLLEVNGVESEWRAEADHIVVPGDAFEPGGDSEIRIVFRAGDEALNRSDEFLYTLFVPDRAHFSIPVFDQPDLKARVGWELTVPEDWVAVANGPELDESTEAGTRRYRFAESRPIPTYLMAFAAGRFSVEVAERDGREYRMYHRETDPEKVERNRDEIFDLVARSVAWMEDYTAIEYPFAKYDFVLIPPFQYGGMEHPGSVFYRASSLMLDESATQGALLGRASLIAHETAHMWFGDLVTMKWFDDVWTKEVFANFMAAKMVDPSFPEVDHDLRFLLAHHPAAYAVDRTAGANPIRQPLENLREAGTLYGAIIYQKAPIVMRQLELRVGVEGMRAGLRKYLQRFSYSNATWPDLIEILNGPTPDDLVAWSNAWVEEAGRPTIRVSFDTAGGTLRPVVRQADPWGLQRFWPQRLQLVELRGMRSRIAANLDLREPEQSFPRWASGPVPRWVLPNGSGVEYGLFVLDDESLGRLMDDVRDIEDPVLRGSAWMVIADALWEGQASPEAVLDLVLDALQTEPDQQMVAFLIGLARSTYWSLLTPEARAERSTAIEGALWDGLAGAQEATLKATWFNGWRGVVSSPDGIERLRGIWSESDSINGLTLSESDFTALAEVLALLDPGTASEVLDEQRARIRNPDRLDRFDFVRPALSSDPQVRESFFSGLADPARREREPWVLDAVAYLNHPLRQDHARSYLRPGLELLGEIQRTGDIFFPGRWLDALLGGHNTPEAAEIVVDVASSADDLGPRLVGKLLQAADGVVRSARLTYGEGPDLNRLAGLRPR